VQAGRQLTFHNLHTGEKLSVVYWENGHYLDDALAAVNHVLRDHRSDEQCAMDCQLLDQLYGLQRRLDSTRPFEVISGYRSPATNAKLRQRSNGVAKRSLHMQGKAIDIRLSGCELERLHRAALDLEAGGVGYYPESGFIHVDTGRVRSW
jgi:uncharacterized protein YcbK (DUF882 family)